MRYAIKSSAGKYLYSGIKDCVFVGDLFIAKIFISKDAASRYADKMNYAYYEWAKSQKKKDRHFPVWVVAVETVEVESGEKYDPQKFKDRFSELRGQLKAEDQDSKDENYE